jgi:hypothetical protein
MASFGQTVCVCVTSIKVTIEAAKGAHALAARRVRRASVQRRSDAMKQRAKRLQRACAASKSIPGPTHW